MAIDATTLAVLRAFVKQSGGSSPGESGQDGREIELQKSDTAIQWRYVGDQEWIDLVQLSEIKGDPGNTGAMANLTIGTVTTLAAGSNATASIESNPDGSGYVLNLGIPEGEDGENGVSINNIPPGGTTGQVLTKNSDSDHDLKWDDPKGGGDVVNVDAELKEYINVAKPAIASAIINKGGSVEDTDSLSDYATRITAIPNNISAAETLPNQTTLVATGLNDSVGIKLNWTDVNASGYLILRKENAKPTTSADGTIVYNGVYASAGYTDTNVQKGEVYYYRIFCRNSKNQYQSTEDGAVAMVDYKDRTGQTLINDLPLGSKIKFGEWNGSEYFWEIVDTQDKNSGYVTVAADQNLGNRQFDAPEIDNPVINRKNQGNNRYAYCAARQLMNSDAVAGSWWTAQHNYDVAPSYATQIDGFLKDFTTYEKNIVVTKTNKCVLDTNDGGGSETVQDKFWFPSSYAMGLEIFQPLEDDHVYEAYTDNASRAYQSNFWLRTISGTASASGVRSLSSNGALGNSAAYNNNAVRPFCLLPTSAYMVWSDSDEAYVFADDSQRNQTV